MKTFISPKRNAALTLIEVIVVFVVAMLLLMVVFPMFSGGGQSRARARSIQCVYNLKQTGLAFRVWEGDHSNSYPMDVSEAMGGSMEYTTGLNAFRHFQVMSNELSTPRILVCPAEWRGIGMFATNFAVFNNSNISYFVGVDAVESNVQMILGGDRNITNGTAIRNGILTLTTNQSAGWTAEMHNKVGNILMADGSVQQESIAGLRTAVANTGFPTNYLQMP